MGATGIMLLICSLPVGIQIALMSHFQSGVDWKTAIFDSLMLTGIILGLGVLSYRLCRLYSEKHHELALDLVRSTAWQMASQLANGNYEEIVTSCSVSRLSSSDVRSVIQSHGKVIVAPPLPEYDKLDVIRLRTEIPKWSVQAPLWTEEEGRSDLTLELEIAITSGRTLVELEDLHVL